MEQIPKDLSVAYHEPLPGVPLLAVLREVVHAAPHADHGLLVLAHGELLEVVVGLETRACAGA